ncbi:SLC7A1.2 family protein [Megaselia abdita]
MTSKLKSMYKTLMRRKPLQDTGESRLAKVLTTFDLTALSIGSTLGVGVYVLAGQVSKNLAGPASIISFLIAAIASIFAGLCYAEFGARVPKAGSAYVYSYVTIGEFVAFIIGWNLIMEYAIGSASVVKAMGKYLDSLLNKSMSTFFRATVPMNIQGLGPYPDFFAFGVTMLFSWAIAIGAKESSTINSIFTLVNLSVVLFVIAVGLFKVAPSNWSIPASSVPKVDSQGQATDYGSGGFMPYGVSGVLKGAATAFYGFIGFDCVATAGEEAKNPRKSIPIAVVVSLLIIFLAYFGISTVLTMMLPYYDQDEEAPLPHVFKHFDLTIPQYVVSVGALCALCTSLMGAMFPLPRIVFAMASDGLLFRFMGVVSEKHRTPFNGTMVTGFLTAILAAVFDLDQLIDMMSIGTLLAYSMVAGCVLILRYDFEERHQSGRTIDEVDNFNFLNGFFNNKRGQVPTKYTSKTVSFGIALFAVFCIPFSLILIKFEENFLATTKLDVVLLGVSSLPLILILFIISRQPVSGTKLFFKVPMVPWLPGVSILINIYLMMRLNTATWIRFGIWISIGLVIYFTYSMRNSEEKKRLQKKNRSVESSTSNMQPLICLSHSSSVSNNL